jgi:hypothetical protein
MAQIRALGAALEAYENDQGQLPPDRSLDAIAPYVLGGMPVDPWGSPYHYRYPATFGTGIYDLYSAGRDGRDDHGSGDDITNWSGVPRAFYRRPFPWLDLGLASTAAVLLLLSFIGLVLGLRRLWKRLRPAA